MAQERHEQAGRILAEMSATAQSRRRESEPGCPPGANISRPGSFDHPVGAKSSDSGRQRENEDHPVNSFTGPLGAHELFSTRRRSSNLLTSVEELSPAPHDARGHFLAPRVATLY